MRTIRKFFTDLIFHSRFSLIMIASAIALIVFTLLRIVLWIKQSADIDANIIEIILAFLIGSISDLGFVSYFILPLGLYLTIIPHFIYQQRWHHYWIYLIFFINLYALFFIATAEWFFWDEFGVRFNFIAVDYLVYTNEVVRNIIESYPLMPILMVILIASIAIFSVVYQKLNHIFDIIETFKQRLYYFLTLIIAGLITFFAIDQSFHQYSTNKYLNELASNGAYQFFAAFKSSELEYRQFYALGNDQQLSDIIKKQLAISAPLINPKGLYDIRRTIRKSGTEKHLNVILITVESLSAEYLKTFGNQENISPFMDQWFKQGLLFTQLYATGTRTIRGLEALTLSYPPTPGHSIVKRADNQQLFNLGYVFKQRGYDTAFLYGGNGYFDNMNAFYSANGYRIIDKSDLKPEEITFANAWGVSDDVIFNRTVKEADLNTEKHRPFFFQIMTTSNHRPFTYPEGKIDIISGKGGRQGGVKFTDYAIHEFIEKAKTKPWFNDTLFVLVADHCGGSARKIELPIDMYHIPLFIYAPKYIRPQINRTLSSQIDVAPTILSLLNFSYQSWFYGEDILAMNPENGRALIANYQKLGLYQQNKFAYLSVQQQIDVILDPLGKEIAVKPETEKELVQKTQAYYQSADYLWRHRLTRYAISDSKASD